jgi:hypothetical protein
MGSGTTNRDDHGGFVVDTIFGDGLEDEDGFLRYGIVASTGMLAYGAFLQEWFVIDTRVEEHLHGARDNSGLLWKSLVFETWLRQLERGCRAGAPATDAQEATAT